MVNNNVVNLRVNAMCRTLNSRVSIIRVFSRIVPTTSGSVIGIFAGHVDGGFGLVLRAGIATIRTGRSNVCIAVRNGGTPTRPRHCSTILMTVNHIPGNGGLSTNGTNIRISSHNFVHISGRLHAGMPRVFTVNSVINRPVLTRGNIRRNRITTRIVTNGGRCFSPGIVPSVTCARPRIT